jgi:hypothetical protein
VTLADLPPTDQKTGVFAAKILESPSVTFLADDDVLYSRSTGLACPHRVPASSRITFHVCPEPAAS